MSYHGGAHRDEPRLARSSARAWRTADNLLTDPWSARLAPYDVLAVLAPGVHGALCLRHVATQHGASRTAADTAFAVFAATSVVVASAIMRALLTA